MKIFDDLHNWIYFHYSVSISPRSLVLILALLASILFLLFSLLINGGTMKSSESLQPGANPTVPAGAGPPFVK